MSEERCPQCGGYRGLARMLDMTSDSPHECDDAFHKTEPAMAEVIDFPQPEATPNTAPQRSALFDKMPEHEKMPEPPVRQAVGNPVCPHCGEEQGIHGKMTRLGPFEIMVVCCRNPNCRKILGAFQALQMQMMPPPAIN